MKTITTGRLRVTFAAITLLALSGCDENPTDLPDGGAMGEPDGGPVDGGQSDGGADGGEQATLMAGPDQRVEGRTRVTLTATTNVPSPSFTWSFAATPSESLLSDADIMDATTASPSFTPDVIGTYTLSVSVGALSDTVSVVADHIWQPLGLAGFSAGGASRLSMALAPDGTPYVSFVDGAEASKATVMRFDDATETWLPVGAAGFSDGAAYTHSMAIAADGTPYLAYQDATASFRIRVQKFTSGTWSTVGGTTVSGETAGEPFLTIATDGTPYVAYLPLAVFSFDGTPATWNRVGGSSLTVTSGDRPAIAVDPSGAPVIAFYDESNGGKLTVSRYDRGAGTWTSVGSAGFSAGEAGSPWLAIAPDGTPYVAYVDAANGYRVAVMRYDDASTTWSLVGGAAASASSAARSKLAIAPSGIPYVAFQDQDHQSEVTVKRYDAASMTWQAVGGARFSPGTTDDIGFAIAPDGTPYVAYVDTAHGNRLTVERLTSLPIP